MKVGDIVKFIDFEKNVCIGKIHNLPTPIWSTNMQSNLLITRHYNSKKKFIVQMIPQSAIIEYLNEEDWIQYILSL